MDHADHAPCLWCAESLTPWTLRNPIIQRTLQHQTTRSASQVQLKFTQADGCSAGTAAEMRWPCALGSTCRPAATSLGTLRWPIADRFAVAQAAMQRRRADCDGPGRPPGAVTMAPFWPVRVTIASGLRADPQPPASVCACGRPGRALPRKNAHRLWGRGHMRTRPRERWSRLFSY